jgi:hypothetical protein
MNLNKTYLTILLLLGFGLADLRAQDMYILRVELDPERRDEQIARLRLDVVRERAGEAVQIIGDEQTLRDLRENALEYEIIAAMDTRDIPDYPSYDEVVAQLQMWNGAYPKITHLVQIGESQEYGVPIYAMKVSDRAAVREDETVVWIDGVHHAREPIGLMSCMVLLEHLVENYRSDPLVTRIVDSLEIWVVPILNTDGYRYFRETSSMWRKNQRDNNRNGTFDPDYDGVDLNRTYDCGWENYENANPSESNYKGTAPFSEKETQAKRDLVTMLRPIAGITYHSYGEYLGMMGGAANRRLPECNLVEEFAAEVADRLRSISGGGTYQAEVWFADMPMSPNWMFKELGTYEVLIETGMSFVPAYSVAQQIAEDNLAGGLYVLERSLDGPGIRGHVVSFVDRNPITAEVKILEYWGPVLPARSTETDYGRFNRFTEPGLYTVTVNAEGYVSDTTQVVVDTGWTEVEFELYPVSPVRRPFVPSGFTLHQNYPNPLNPGSTIRYELEHGSGVSLVIYDLLGEEVAILMNGYRGQGDHEVQWIGRDRYGREVPTGIYIARLSIISRTAGMYTEHTKCIKMAVVR